MGGKRIGVRHGGAKHDRHRTGPRAAVDEDRAPSETDVHTSLGKKDTPELGIGKFIGQGIVK